MSADARQKRFEHQARDKARKQAAEKDELLRRVNALELAVQENQRTLAAVLEHLGLNSGR